MTKNELDRVLAAHARWLESGGVAGERANLSGANLSEADLRWADLRWANLSGANLSGANLIGADLSGADLSGANLSGADLSGANLSWANLSGADLSGANLSWADLRGASLSGASLSGANLGGAYLRGAVPVISGIHRAVFDAAGAQGALNMAAWHTCETTHCRAGWVVTLAGYAGAKLEEALGTSAAAALIYYASDPELESVPDFHCSDAEALADMARLAGEGQ